MENFFSPNKYFTPSKLYKRIFFRFLVFSAILLLLCSCVIKRASVPAEIANVIASINNAPLVPTTFTSAKPTTGPTNFIKSIPALEIELKKPIRFLSTISLVIDLNVGELNEKQVPIMHLQ